MMKAIVLGHTGFVGKNLVTFLEQNNIETVGLSRDECDLRDYDETIQALQEHADVDVIFNCAANVGSVHYVTSYAGDVIHDNTLMALNLYRSVLMACPTAVIVNPLSNCCYANGTEIQDETKWLEGAVHPSVFSFGNFKRVLYYIAGCYNIQYGVRSVNLMFPGIYGPGDSTDPNKVHALNGMIIRMLGAIETNDEKFEIWGTGKPVREWIYIDDVCKIMHKSIDLGDVIEPINVAQGKGFTIAETGGCIAAATGYSGELTFNTDYQDGAPVKILGMGKFATMFEGYEFSDHQEGISHTVEYYKGVLK